MKKVLFISIFFTFLILSLFNNLSIAQVTYTESFDSTAFPPTGWTVYLDVGTVTWLRYTSTQYPSGYAPHSGAGMAGYNSYYQYPPGFARLVSPSFDLSGRGGNTDSVVFWFFRGNYVNANDSLGVYVNTTTALAGSTWLGNIKVYNGSSPAWYRFAYYIPASYNGATNYVIFRASSGWYNDIFLDDVVLTNWLLPPPPPTLLSPPNNATGLPLTDTLVWNASSGATTYGVQVATDAGFTTIILYDTTVATTSRIISGLTPLTYYYWHVKAKNAAGWSAYSSAWNFKTIGPASGVTLIFPPNDTTNMPVNINFVWTKASDQTFKLFNQSPAKKFTVSNYWFALYTDTTQAPVVVDSTLTDTTKTVNGLSNYTKYWWKVKAKNQIDWGSFSGYFDFTTIVAVPAPPTLISPPDGAQLTNLTPTLVWSNVQYASSYRVQVSTDSAFGTAQLDTTIAIDSITVPAGKLAYGTTYYWHVRASNIAGNSNYSVRWHFLTPVGITNNGKGIPKEFKLYANYPNPFNPSSTIKFDLPKSADVKMIVYNLIGQEVATLVNGHFEAGAYSVTWDAANYPSGVYFYKITAGQFTDIHKMVLLK